MIHFRVAGRRPRTQGSLTFVGKGAARHPDGLKAWRALLRLEGRRVMRDRIPADEPLLLGCVFLLARLRGKRVYPWAKDDGDLDKYLRAVGDALSGVCWTDDARIVGGWQGKLYAPRPGEEGALIWIAPLAGRPLLESIAGMIPGA